VYICKDKNHVFAEVLSLQKIIGDANRKLQKIYGPQIANPQIAPFAECRKSKKSEVLPILPIFGTYC
jgi:hypothetical protein